MKKRDVYLENMPLEKARAVFFEDLKENGILKLKDPEIIDVRQALGRITAEPVFAKISSPHYHAAAMDGIAVAAKDTFF